MTLTEKARKIIMQSDCTDDDILELSRISFQMSEQYRKSRKICGTMEWEYNKARAEKSLEARKDENITSAEAQDIGKFYAECEYGNYREYSEACIGMRAVIEQIDGFRIAYYRKNKGIDTAIKAGIN